MIHFIKDKDAQGGNHPVFCIPAAIPSSAASLLQTIDAFNGCLYPQPRYIFPPALRKAVKQRNLQPVKIPLDFLNCWPT
jgi:hypothetical protein